MQSRQVAARRHVVAASWVWSPQRTFSNGISNALLNGWTLTGFHRFQSGSPLVFTTGVDVAQNGVLNSGGQYAALVAGATADDLLSNFHAMRSFVRTCFVKPLSDEDFETALCWNVVVPARIRANLAARDLDLDDVLQQLEVPLLVTQGRADVVVLPAMAEHISVTCPTAELSWYDGVGHVPHLEEPERFNQELSAFTRRVRA